MGKRLIGFDGAHLKKDMNQRGVFLVATVKDNNNHIFPIALALVSVENYETWCWFMKVFQEALKADRFMILSDRQKGLLQAVHEVFPRAGHRFYLRHIMDNINRAKHKLSSGDRATIYRLARSECESDFNLYLCKLTASNPGAAAYLLKKNSKGEWELPPHHWVKYQFLEKYEIPSYNEITSNLSEQANNWMGTEIRSAKPLDAFHLYFSKLAGLISQKRQMAANWSQLRGDDGLVPRLYSQFVDRCKVADMCGFEPLMHGAYSIQHLGPVSQAGYVHPWRLVNLPAQECTCGNWQDEEFPCVHALKAATEDGTKFESLYDAGRMSIRHFRETYSFQFLPWPTNVTLIRNNSHRVPEMPPAPDRIGKRGNKKPGPKPNSRKKAKNAL